MGNNEQKINERIMLDETTIDTISKLRQENITLKCRIGGYKTSNEKYRKQEAQYLDFYDKTVKDLRVEIFDLKKAIIEKDNEIATLKDKCDELEALRNYVALPWYKRIFSRPRS